MTHTSYATGRCLHLRARTVRSKACIVAEYALAPSYLSSEIVANYSKALIVIDHNTAGPSIAVAQLSPTKVLNTQPYAAHQV